MGKRFRHRRMSPYDGRLMAYWARIEQQCCKIHRIPLPYPYQWHFLTFNSGTQQP